MMAGDDNNSARENVMQNVKFVRVARTDSSEIFILWQNDTRLGQIDLHLGYDLVHATLILEKDLDAEAQADLVEQIDQDLVSSHLPRFTREDFLVTVFRGTELEPFADGEPDIEDDDGDDEY